MAKLVFKVASDGSKSIAFAARDIEHANRLIDRLAGTQTGTCELLPDLKTWKMTRLGLNHHYEMQW